MKRMSKSVFFSVLCVCVVLDCIVFLAILALTNYNFTFAKTVAFLSFSIFISVVLSLICAKIITKKITKPINDIDLSSFEKDSVVYKELTLFAEKLQQQRESIKQQMDTIERKHKLQDKVRREFTANVSHELKTPLTSISGYAEIIKNGMVRQEDIARFSEKIYNEAGRLIGLVGDIIKLSRLDENAVDEKKERIELYSLCEAIMGRLESAAAKRGITFELIGMKTEILGIPRIIDEMIYNLCDNAIKYNRDNGKVTVSVKQTTSEILLSVSDTGIGIPKEETERVFERFYRVNKSHSNEIGGTGLGLSIVKHGAAVHNAKLSVESEINKGTTFTIKFEY